MVPYCPARKGKFSKENEQQQQAGSSLSSVQQADDPGRPLKK